MVINTAKSSAPSYAFISAAVLALRMIVGIENSDGNTNVRFHQKDTLRRFFERLEQKGLTVNRFRADFGSC